MSPVREFVEGDIPQAADLNWSVLRHGKGPAPPALRSYFNKLFLQNPWFDRSLPSLVFEDDGKKIIGFLGVVPRNMALRGAPIRVTFGSNLVVHPKSRSTLAGLHLVKAYLEGKQDLSLTDSANELTARVQKGLGATTLLLESMHWARPLRPSHYVLDAFARLKKGKLSAALKYLGKPFCAIVDGAGVKIFSNDFHSGTSRLKGEVLSVETHLECLSVFTGKFALRPLYDLRSLSWLLDFMDEMQMFGRVRRLVLRNDQNEIVGWYIYYIKPGRVGEVVQIAGEKQYHRDILDHLFRDAWQRGAIGLHGRVDAQWLEDLSDKGCFFYRRGGWVQAHSRKPELVQLLQMGDAFLTRLDGEWCLSCSVDSR